MLLVNKNSASSLEQSLDHPGFEAFGFPYFVKREFYHYSTTYGLYVKHLPHIMLLVNKNSASSLVQSIYLWKSFDMMKISPNFGPDKKVLFWMFILTFLHFHWL